MVLNIQMKPFKIFVIFFAFTLLFSCESDEAVLKDISFVNCNECTADEPSRAEIRIKLADPYKFGSANGVVFIDVYEGNLEDEVLFRSIQTSSGETTTNLTINKKYTVTATYYINDKTYIAVNSITPRVKYTESSCQEPCYYTVPKSVNLKLKYTK
jgi:hypothetical protein